MEAADKDLKSLQGTKNTGVHKGVESQMVLPAKQPQWQQHPCYRCGKANHTPTKLSIYGSYFLKLWQSWAYCCSVSVRKKNKFSKQTEQVDILISKNQALQILYLKHIK